MPTTPDLPLYEIKANLFKALANPARIRILETLSATAEPVAVSDILTATDLEPTLLSQHLGVLKRHHVVTSSRTGNAVHYELTNRKVAELLKIARLFLADTLEANQQRLELLDTLPPIGTP